MAIQVPSTSGPSVRSRALPAPQVRPEPVDNSGLALLDSGLKAAHQIAQKSADDADTAAVIQAESQLSDWKLNTMFAPETGVYNRKGANALNITNQTLPQFDQEAERISAGLTNERQRARFQQISASQRASLNGELNRYEFGERNQYYDDVDKASLESAKAGALAYYQTPKQVAYYQNKGTRVIAAQGQRKGLPPELIGQEVQRYVSGVATDVIGRMASEDPLKAQQYYASAYNTMTPEDQVKISGVLGTSLRKQWGSQIAHSLYAGGTLGLNGLPALVIQAESSGDSQAISPKGARGLMQLMPDTAKEMAAELGVPYDEARLTADPNYNVSLGTAYLNKMLGRYDNNPTLAVAAYNAGPGAVDGWLKTNGDPRTGEVSDAEWIARIPYAETKAYTGKIVAQLEPQAPGSLRYANSVKQANRIQDPELRKLTLDGLNDLKQADDLERQANYDLAAEQVYANGYEALDARLEQQLSADDKIKLRGIDKHRREGTEPETDLAKYQELLSMPTEQLARISLERDARPYLNNADFAKITSAFQKASQGDATGQKGLQREENANRQIMGMLGILSGDSLAANTESNLQKQRTFRAALQNRIDEYVARHDGQQPNSEELQSLRETLLLDVRLSGAGTFGGDTAAKLWEVAPEQFADMYTQASDLEISEIPPSDRIKIVRQLREEQQPTSDANIIARYLQKISGLGVTVK